MNEQMGLIGRKLGMTQLFQDDGDVIPVTVIEAGPCTILQVKRQEGTDGYSAVQLGLGERDAARTNRPDLGRFAKAGVAEHPSRWVQEIRVPDADAGKLEVGKALGPADVFTAGEKVDVQGVSKGRGFSGVMRRHHFAGFTRSHGVHEYARHGGSVGTRLTPGMTLAGKKMPGRLGGKSATVQAMVIAKVDAERNLVYVRGGVPGPNGAVVAIRKAVKHQGKVKK